MGLMPGALSLILGPGRNAIAETVGVFRENPENGAAREAALNQAALAQFAAEFALPRKGLFDRTIDGLNRVPRPAMALGTLALFVAAMVDPVWFASRMQGMALVPEPLWWLLGAIVGFYFGARHQAKGQEFRQSIAETLARAGELRDALGLTQDAAPQAAGQRPAATQRYPGNPALAEWSEAGG
ncbi:holin family protein [Tropicimonas sp.]|uniref:holin family protein n=1 Tax=Tropicimonas sp. TaxID=2067044 RepID=UPI003A8BC3A6